MERFWLQVEVQNRTKIEIKGSWKNNKKMITKMAIRSHIGAYDTVIPDGSGARGGGRRRAKPLHPDQVGSMS